MNFLPYIERFNSKTNKKINILLDTGANKNLIRPGLFPEILLKTTKETQVKNMFGVQKSNKKI
jgi:hypothetical protein